MSPGSIPRRPRWSAPARLRGWARAAHRDRRVWAMLIAGLSAGAIALTVSSHSKRPGAFAELVARVGGCANDGNLARTTACQAEALAPLFRARSVPGAIAVVERLGREPRLSRFEASCHRTMHEVAKRYARERAITISNLGDVLAATYGPGCPSGFNHGLIIHAAAGLSPDDLVESKGRICDPIVQRFGRHACVHGFGHAFMVVLEGNVGLALDWCRRLGPVAAPDCADAVFHGTALSPAVKRPPSPHELCRDRRGKFAEVCWRRGWTSLMEQAMYRGQRVTPQAWIARCQREPAMSRAGCITTLSRLALARPQSGPRVCSALPAIDQIPCVKGIVVSRLGPADRAAHLRLIRRCRVLGRSQGDDCTEIVARNLNVLTNGRFEHEGCPMLQSSRSRRSCRRGARRFEQALITYG